MKPLVSIIIPVYNGERYLAEAIDSALAQTYKPVEIIVVNDGSKDRTEEIALSYGDKIRYFTKDNGGVSTALNMGISNMRGEYFSWLSHDDIYMPDKIETEINSISDDPLGIAYSDYNIIDKDGKQMAVMDIKRKYPSSDLTFGLFPILRQVLSGCSLLIHKSHFARVGTFDEDLRVTQDYDLWFRMFKNQRLVYINKPLVMMREHGSQVTHNYKRNIDESDKLWLDMMRNVTAKEACCISGTERGFWDSQTEFLCYTQYNNAKEYAKSRLKALGGGGVSLNRFIRIAAYRVLSGVSRLMKAAGVQGTVKKSCIFRWGYKLWFGVRYR